jgi:hypothetical protein
MSPLKAVGYSAGKHTATGGIRTQQSQRIFLFNEAGTGDDLSVFLKVTVKSVSIIESFVTKVYESH